MILWAIVSLQRRARANSLRWLELSTHVEWEIIFIFFYFSVGFRFGFDDDDDDDDAHALQKFKLTTFLCIFNYYFCCCFSSHSESFIHSFIYCFYSVRFLMHWQTTHQTKNALIKSKSKSKINRTLTSRFTAHTIFKTFD